jgi:hypothetical protein
LAESQTISLLAFPDVVILIGSILPPIDTIDGGGGSDQIGVRDQ